MDIEKINVGGTEYDVCDSTARDELSQLNSNMELQNNYGYAVYGDIVSTSGSWQTHAGVSTEQRNVGESVNTSNAYNLRLIPAGTYLIIARAYPKTTSTTGIRGLRLYIGETSDNPEQFTAPSGHEYTVCYLLRVITISTESTVRIGLYQNSGESVTWGDIRIDAIRIG